MEQRRKAAGFIPYATDSDWNVLFLPVFHSGCTQIDRRKSKAGILPGRDPTREDVDCGKYEPIRVRATLVKDYANRGRTRELGL